MRRALALLLLLAGAATACTPAAKDKDKVLAAIDRTEQLARTFSYTELAGGTRTVVSGAVADDFRYRASVTVDGRPELSEIVADDARALQLQDPAALGSLAKQPAGTATTAPTAGPALPVGQWEVDPRGAASMTLESAPAQAGPDPVLDSLTFFAYLRQAIAQAADVHLYNPEGENYRPRLDPFPHPAPGVLRYDLTPPDLPARNRIGTGQNIGLQNTVPGVPFFRLLAVYVRDGLVIDVREQVSVLTRLTDSESNLEARLGDFTNVSPNASYRVQAQALLSAINRQLARGAQPLIRPRTVDFRLSGIGRPQAVSIPSGATQTNLSSLSGNGVVLYEQH